VTPRLLARNPWWGVALCLALWAPAPSAQRLTIVPGPSGSVKDATIPIGSPPGGIFTMMSADLKGDGRRDLILGMGSSPQFAKQSIPMHILRPNAAGTALDDVTRRLLGQGALPMTEHSREIAVGDFNHDGRLDIFIAAHGYDTAPFAGERNVLLYSNSDGTYTDRSASLPQAPDFSHSSAVGDIDSDGLPDVLVNNLPSPVMPYFLLGKADGNLQQVTDPFAPGVTGPGLATFLAALITDIDGDGFQDVVLVASGAERSPSVVLYNDGKGSVANRPRSELPAGAFGPGATGNDVVAMDIDNDGRMDLLVLSTQSNALQDQGAAIQVLMNKGNGVFLDETAARLGASATRTNGIWWTFLRVADIDGDGRLDFFASGSQQLDANRDVTVVQPMIWLNNSDGTFTAINNDIMPNVPSPFELMDVDGDGRLDFVTASGTDALGQIHYRTFLNRTPRTAPVAKRVIEYYNASLDHYFITWVPDEITKLDAGTEIKGWTRTGKVFNTFSGPKADVTDVCRIYIIPGKGDSHFFGRGAQECTDTMAAHPEFILEEGKFLAMRLPTAGVCPLDTTPVYRVFSNRADANHRYMTDRATRAAMVAKGWLAEGDGPDLVVMCAGLPPGA